MFSYLIVYILIIFVVVLLLVAAATGYSAFVILSAAARTAFAMCRRLPPARHPLMWLYAALLGYLLFPVLLADFAAAAHVHDITVLRWWNNAWLCAVLVAANLPLLPLLHGEIRSGSPCFGTAFCVWCVFAAAWGLPRWPPIRLSLPPTTPPCLTRCGRGSAACWRIWKPTARAPPRLSPAPCCVTAARCFSTA